MSKTIIDNELLKDEIKALYTYVNRDEYNLDVVEVMVNEIQDIVKGLRPCEKTDVSYDKGVVDYLKTLSGEYIPTHCPHCGSKNIQYMYGRLNLDSSGQISHYICKDCHEEFNV